MDRSMVYSVSEKSTEVATLLNQAAHLYTVLIMSLVTTQCGMISVLKRSSSREEEPGYHISDQTGDAVIC